MSKKFARPLNTADSAYMFITSVLELSDRALKDFGIDTWKLATRIQTAETLIVDTKDKDTLSSSVNRHTNFKTQDSRKLLREQIFRELYQLERLDDDEAISLGKGGAKPKIDPVVQRKAFLITGLPASGKSSIVNIIADTLGGYVIDSDFAKRKLPEFDSPFGANLVHLESQLITMGLQDEEYDQEPNLLDYCISKGFNIVVPKIGYSKKSVEDTRDYLISMGYEVHLTLVSLDRQKSTIRAVQRFLKTSRYVPLSLIFDCYANDPILAYYRTKSCEKWASSGKISTDVVLGEPPFHVEGTDINPSHFFNKVK